MKSVLLFLLTTFVAYGSAQENLIINIKQVVSGCGDSCDSAAETDNKGSSTKTDETTTTPTTALDCTIGNETYPTGTDLLAATCLDGQWNNVSSYQSPYCKTSVQFSTFDGSSFMVFLCSYDIIFVSGETTATFAYGINSLTISNHGYTPLVCSLNISTTISWDCGITLNGSMTSFPSYGVLASFDQSSVFVITWNGIVFKLEFVWIYVSVAEVFNKTTLQGLCGGNINSNPADDFILRNGTSTTDSEEFMKSWVTNGTSCDGK